MRLDRLRSMRWPYLLALASLAVVMGIGLFLFFSGKSDRDGLPYRSYAFEARMTSPDAMGTMIIRGWYEAPSRTRWDIGPEALRGWMRVLITTEKGSVAYEPGTNTYYEEAHALGTKLPPIPFPLVSNAAIGPMVSYLDPAKALPAGTESVLGVQGDVYKQDGVTWVLDPRREFVMRQEFDSDHPMSNVKIEVTKLEYDVDLPGSTWVFTPPADAKKQRTVAPTPGAPDLFRLTPLPNPFLSPMYVPRGYGNPRTQQSADGRGDLQTESRTWDLGDQSFEIRQALLSGRPSATPIGTPVNAGGLNAGWVMNGDKIVIVWNTDSLVISVSSSDLPMEELLRIAESMQ